MLYDDFDNAKALKLYNSLGFIESGKDILYRLKV
jgi:predicted GNAT family acetyltransferase